MPYKDTRTAEHEQWKAIVEVHSDQDLTLPENHEAFENALDAIEACEAITRHPNGWVTFDFLLYAADALDALVDAVNMVRTMWEEMTRIDLPQVLDVHVTVTEYARWLDNVDPGGHIRMWAEQDFSKQPLPSPEEQQHLLKQLDGKE